MGDELFVQPELHIRRWEEPTRQDQDILSGGAALAGDDLPGAGFAGGAWCLQPVHLHATGEKSIGERQGGLAEAQQRDGLLLGGNQHPGPRELLSDGSCFHGGEAAVPQGGGEILGGHARAGLHHHLQYLAGIHGGWHRQDHRVAGVDPELDAAVRPQQHRRAWAENHPRGRTAARGGNRSVQPLWPGLLGGRVRHYSPSV